MIERLKDGDQLLQIYKEGRSRFVYPAGRVIHVQRYEVGNEPRAIVYVEMPKRLKRKRFSVISKVLGTRAKVLKRVANTRFLRNGKLIHALLHLWPRGVARGPKSQDDRSVSN